MAVDMNSSSFISDYTYATRKYHNVMKKYQGYFNEFFRLDLAMLHYARWNDEGDLLQLVSMPEAQELCLELQGVYDSPFFTKQESLKPGNTFAYANKDINNIKHNNFRRKQEEKFKINIGFGTLEKYPDFAQLVCWEFYIPPEEKNLLETQDIILMDCINNAKKIKDCFNQFKKEVLLPIVNNNDLYRVNLKDIKKDKYDTQRFVLDNTSNEMKDAILSAGVVEQREKGLTLDNVKFNSTEIRILDCYLQNMAVKDIAKELKLSPDAVEKRIKSIKAKLDVKKN